MFKLKSQETGISKNVKIKHHGRVYFVNKAKLNYTLNKMGLYAKFNYTKEDLREFLFRQRFLYTEFHEHISDGFREVC